MFNEREGLDTHGWAIGSSFSKAVPTYYANDSRVNRQPRRLRRSRLSTEQTKNQGVGWKGLDRSVTFDPHTVGCLSILWSPRKNMERNHCWSVGAWS